MALSPAERDLCDHIALRRERLLDELAAHVAIPTGTGHDEGVNAYRALLAARLKAIGAEMHLEPGTPRPEWLDPPHARRVDPSIPPTAVFTREASSGPPRILISGHLDTVHDPKGAFNALTLLPDGNTAVGPGAADMKGGILIAVTALEVLAELGHDLSWTFVLNADEETGSIHSASALQQAARRHEVGLVLEPALPDGSLVIERMGSGAFRIDAHGRSAHVGRDFAKGASAVYALARAIGRVESMVDVEAGRIVNVGPLTGGRVVNAVPDHACAWGNARFAGSEVQQQLERELQSLATDPATLPWIEVHTLFNRPAKPLIEPVRRLAEQARAVAEDLGQPLPFASTGGVCDGNILQDVGLPTIDTLGVRGGNLHRDDEYIDVASLVERCQLFGVLVMRLAGGAQ